MPESQEPLPNEPAGDTAQVGDAAQAGGPPPAIPPVGEGELAHSSIRFETRDVAFRFVLIVFVATVLVGATIFGLVYVFFRADTARLATRRESEFPLAEHPSNELPAEPRLEQVDRLAGIARENVYVRESAQEGQLDLYGETKEKGFVHIPIRRAMEALMEAPEGPLPVRKDVPTTNKDNGLLDSGSPNSGRKFREAPK
jgi:hypothetical protein